SLTDNFPQLLLPGFPVKRQFNMEIALNECYATILSKFFMTAPENLKQERVDLHQRWLKSLSRGTDSITLKTSMAYGRNIADAVYDWSSTDSLGYEANHHNYDRNYFPPGGPGKWVPSVDFPMPALLPYWGKVRPFIIKPDQYIAAPLPEFTTAPDGPYQLQALELVALSRPLSEENKWIAEFWNDDRPGLTFSPAGHWLAITNQVIEKEQPPVEKALETYLKVGFALADAMIACFNAKYIYNLERPETYIQENIDKTWKPFSPSPPFPSYPSGHAMIGAAAAAVLTDLYGSNYKMTDRSHMHLKEFKVKPRKFNSFQEMCRENAISRVFLGVHWRFDCEEGLRLGDMIGKQVAQLQVQGKLKK
ncbi:MAG TPA: vanadium-dependent haloperoxidase, partial [Saprospiraceae bacterium]|nr:vanadium-dependent haloperoxidase [Saprospiraceae bacterium]